MLRTLVLLGQTTPEVIETLVHILNYSNDWQVCVAAAKELGKLGQATPEIIAALTVALKNTEWLGRYTAATSLGKLGKANPEVIGALLQALKDGNETTRYKCIKALGRLSLATPEIIIAIQQLFENGTWKERIAAAETLIKLGGVTQKAIFTLINALQNGTTHEINMKVFKKLFKLNHITLITENLLQLLKEDNGWYGFKWKIAIAALGKLGKATPEIVDALLQALKNLDCKYQTSAAAASALGDLGQATPDIIAALIQAMDDKNPFDIRTAAIGALIKLGQASSQVITVLKQMLKDKELNARLFAGETLIKLGQAIPEVISTFMHVTEEGYEWNPATINILGDLSNAAPPEVIHGLIRHLRFKNFKSTGSWETRFVSSIALGKLGKTTPEVITALQQELTNGQWVGKYVTAVALAKLGQTTSEVLVALFKTLPGEMRHDHRTVFLQEINEIPPATIILALQQALKHKEESAPVDALAVLAEAFSPKFYINYSLNKLIKKIETILSTMESHINMNISGYQQFGLLAPPSLINIDVQKISSPASSIINPNLK